MIRLIFIPFLIKTIELITSRKAYDNIPSISKKTKKAYKLKLMLYEYKLDVFLKVYD
jgi:hypothetical protein